MLILVNLILFVRFNKTKPVFCGLNLIVKSTSNENKIILPVHGQSIVDDVYFDYR